MNGAITKFRRYISYKFVDFPFPSKLPTFFASFTTLGPSHLSKEHGPDRHQQLLEQWRFQCNCEEKMAKIRVSFDTLKFHSGKLTFEMENPTFSIGNVS